MGLFSKVCCDVCGDSMNSHSKTEISGGAVCPACLRECRPSFKSNLRYKTAEEIKAHIEFQQQNRAAFKSFTPTDNVDKKFFVDRNSRRFWIDGGYSAPQPPIVYSFDDVLDYELVVNGETYTQGGVKVGRALVGGAVFGPAGAVLGGISGKKKQTEQIDKMAVRILLDHEYEPTEEVPLISSPTEKGSYEYDEAEENASRVLALLGSFTAGKKSTGAADAGSAADELLKYKQLLDCGAITEEEFQAKKAELL